MTKIANFMTFLKSDAGHCSILGQEKKNLRGLSNESKFVKIGLGTGVCGRTTKLLQSEKYRPILYSKPD
jgi:hypothetical protein